MLLQREGERPGKLPLDHPLLRAMVYAVSMLIRDEEASKVKKPKEYRKPYQERL